LVRFTRKRMWVIACFVFYAIATSAMALGESSGFTWWGPATAVVGIAVAELIGCWRNRTPSNSVEKT